MRITDNFVIAVRCKELYNAIAHGLQKPFIVAKRETAKLKQLALTKRRWLNIVLQPNQKIRLRRKK